MAGLGNPMMLAIAVLAIPAIYATFRKSEKYNKVLGLSRVLIILLLAGAAAQPHIQTEQQISEQAEVVILQDESNSAELMNKQDLEFDNIKVTERTIASGNSSDLQNAFLRNLEENKNYLAISDFQSTSSLENVAEKFRARNATLNALRYDMERDYAVSISGPESTVPGAESRFLIDVESTGSTVEPRVTVDGERAEIFSVDNNTWEITRTFNEKGSHTIKASIALNDTYRINNQYHHAIEVTEKPKILLIGQEGALGDKLGKFYDITYRNSVPDDLSPYYSVIATEDVQNNELTSYVTEGNGLVYTGDPTEDSLDILPVKKVDPAQLTDAAQIVLAIDISIAGGGECVRYETLENGGRGSCQERAGEGGAVARSKAIAYNLVEKLPYNNEIGIIAYNDQAYKVSDIVPLSRNREKLKNNIARLTTSGPGLHQVGLNGSKELLNGRKGNVILISDGYVPERNPGDSAEAFSRKIPRESMKVVSKLNGVRLYTIGVGGNPNEKFLTSLSTRADGKYYKERESGQLRFTFTAGGAQGKTTPIVVTERDDFITNNLALSTAVENFDPVEAKSGANALVSGTNGIPFLTTWRYGIGRVAAFSGDTEQLENTMRTDPLLVSRSVAWTVGDPKRKLDKWIRIENSRQPDDVEVRASYEIDGFKRQSGGVYTRTIRPNSTGFGSVEGKFYGYNYPVEYEKVGYSDQMEKVVRSTGGNVYSPDERQQLVQDIKNFSEKKVVKRQELGSYLIALALLIFLAEVGYRKVNGKK